MEGEEGVDGVADFEEGVKAGGLGFAGGGPGEVCVCVCVYVCVCVCVRKMLYSDR